MKIHEAVATAIAQSDVKPRMLSAGLEPVGNTPDEFATYLRAQLTKWSKVIKAAGIRAD